jgi:hypothetical protein
VAKVTHFNQADLTFMDAQDMTEADIPQVACRLT